MVRQRLDERREQQRRQQERQQDLSKRELSAALFVEAIDQTTGPRLLRPEYDAESAAWVLSLLGRKRALGTLEAIALIDRADRIIGRFICIHEPGGHSEVLQIGGRAKDLDLVVSALFHHAVERGSTVLSGRLEPRLVPVMRARSDIPLTIGEFAMNVVSKEPDISAVVHRGDALLSMIEGERLTAATVDLA